MGVRILGRSDGRAPVGRPLVRTKICGLTTSAQAEAAAAAGAAYVGLVLFPPSPRAVTLAQARAIALAVPLGVAKVALMVDPTDAELDAVLAEVPLDMLQLHGRESPARVAAVRARAGLPVMKAVGVATAEDLAAVAEHEAVADQILLDAKPPRGASRPGGLGARFDWTLLEGFRPTRPWMLAGGLTPETVAAAVRATGARQVDVSSGVESAPGVKDPDLVRAFVAAAGGAG